MGRKKQQEDDTDKVSLIGRRVEKDFQGFGKFGGTVVAYITARGFYKVVYDDGDREELEFEELESLLVDVDDLSKKRGRPPKQKEELNTPSEDVPDTKRRKRGPSSKEDTPSIRSNGPEDSTRIACHRPSRQKLKEEDLSSAEEVKENKTDEESVLKGQISSCQTSKRKRQDEECGSGPSSVKATRASSRNIRSQNLLQAFDDEAATPGGDESSDDGAGNDVDEDDESSSSDKNALLMVDANAPEELNLPALVPLPPSSKTIPLPDDLVVEAFAVYSFLRSFSHALFLCPFCLDDFVSAVKANTPNHLIDSIHLILLQALRRHLQRLLKDDCVKSRECLRQRDWNLLDNVTWPSFLMVFLSTHGFGKAYGQPISLLGLLDDEYYKVSIKVKLAVLGFLCDHVLETEEIRAVLDARELESASQIREKDRKGFGGKVIGAPEVHQSSVAKDHNGKVADDVIEREKGADDAVKGATSLLTGPMHAESKEKNPTDWNSDECVLCGMNGNLICCDGCPAAYHSRCVGISRSSLPPGDWFCPECIVEKVGGEQSRRMRGLGGCISLGVDPYGRSFMAACGHLLVVNPSDSMRLSCNYYNEKDIAGVLQNLELVKPFCNEIATAICEHWDISAKHLFLSISAEHVSETLPVSSEGGSNNEQHFQGAYTLAQDNETVCREAKAQELDTPPPQSLVYDGNERFLESEPLTAQTFDHVDARESLMVPMVSEPPAGQLVVEDHASAGAPLQKAASDLNSTLSSRYIPISECDSKVAEQAPENMLTRPLEAALVKDPDLFTSRPLERAVAVTAHFTPLSQCLEQDPYLAQNISDRDTKGRFLTASQREQLPTDQSQKPAPRVYLHTDSVQRLSSYINHYVFGDAAATAAANLALMMADQLTSSEKAKKKTTTIAEQLSAFCKAPARFCWPSFRRKLMDAPKDRCGWCFTCTSNMKRGCLMNQAATQLAAGATCVTGGIRPGKSGSGHLPAVTGYLLYMEESLHGLLTGPWANIMYRKQWRKRLEQATSLFDAKASLLDLEAHLRSVVLTEDWSKCMEDAPDMVLGGSVPSSVDDSLSKKASGRKLSRRSGVSRRALPKSSSTALGGAVQWARRGKVAHRVSGWATLSSKVARKAGRQGGLKKITGISYADGEEVSKRSKQTVWRAKAQAARTIAELAVQVRCLDSVLRWEDLVSKVEVQSTPNVSENDGNAEIPEFGVHAKSVKESVQLYLIDSILIQKQAARQNLSAASRLQNSKNQQVWVDEWQVPLFLLKEFEEKERASKQTEAPKLIMLQKHHLESRKILKKDVFKFLWERAGFSIPTKLVVSITCKFCSLKVAASLAVQCHLCREPFHKECTVASHLVGKPELKYTCCGCLKVSVGQKYVDSQKIKEETIIPRPGTQRNENTQLTSILPNKPKKIVFTQSKPQLTSPVIRPQLTSPVIKLSLKPPLSATTSLKAPISATTSGLLVKQEFEREGSQILRRPSVSVPKSSEKRDYEGVTWRKYGRNSRMCLEGNMLFPIQKNYRCHGVPKCYACNQQFQGDLIYIKCESCPLWFHGAAVGVNQSNVKEVLGFRCHKCRKKGVPSCPYGSNHRMHKRVAEASRVGDVCITKRTPLPLLRPDENQQKQCVASSLPRSSAAISLECATVRPTQLQPSLDRVQQRALLGKSLVDTKPPTEMSMATFEACVQGSNTCFAKRTPLQLSRAVEKQPLQHVGLPVSDSIPAISLDCAAEKSSEETQLLVLTPDSEELQQVTSLVGNEPLVNGPVWTSTAEEAQQCVQDSKGESEQIEDAQNGSDPQDGQYLLEGDEALSKEMIDEDGPEKNGEMSTQPTLSFMELLSSEDDRVEELAEVAMDFGDDMFDLFDLDMLMDSVGVCGMGAASIEPEASLGGGDPCQHLDQSVIQTIGFIADSSEDVCAVCCNGSLPCDLQCFRCGVAVHQQCLAGQSAATETRTSYGWTCDVCKAELSRSQDVLADRMQRVDSRILLQS